MDIPLSKIWIDRENRQRREIVVDDLLESIPIRGVIVPIIVTKEEGPQGQPYKLLAGERRYTASTQLKCKSIPARLLSDLAPDEQEHIELEENVRRKDITWQEMVRAYARIHALNVERNGPDWTRDKTAKSLGVHHSLFNDYVRVAENLHRPEVANSESLNRANNFLGREADRLAADAVSDILSTDFSMAKPLAAQPIAEEPKQDEAPAPKPQPLIKPAEESILQESFIDFSETYSGRPFNFLHCDFPYGANVFGGKWSGRSTWHNYEDTPDIYFALIRALCKNLDKLLAPSAHIMFWLSADVSIQYETIRLFGELAPMLAFSTFPLVWVKSDNVGIVPDPKREPRRIVETALIASREDRPIIRPVSNAIAAPTSKEHHPHTKPVPVLKHFFTMFVDAHTRMLDPTCGGGSSLRAAEALGADHVLGLEINDEYVENSRKALKSERILRLMSDKKEP